MNKYFLQNNNSSFSRFATNQVKLKQDLLETAFRNCGTPIPGSWKGKDTACEREEERKRERDTSACKRERE